MTRRELFLNDRLSDAQITKFKLFDDEELIFACREHWLPLVLRLVRQALTGFIIAVALGFVFAFFLKSLSLAVSAFFLIVLLTNIVAVRELIHWCYHLYIATNKQLIEVRYSPLLSHAINSVLLDQIRCTEIDVEMYGIIPELIGIGNVAITFDRPTHKDEFVIKGIRSPRSVANLLSAQIHQSVPSVPKQTMQSPEKLLWIRELKQNKYRFLGDSNYGTTIN